ncbi:two-component regulator propeller domain-containing protein [Arcticibacter pallidicorallinus]|nr:two-component regulator propeller domain-containing protein [Arcticibacter pallidicorallinus]
MREIFKHYSTGQGLSHDGVLCITRDRDGFMWFGTWDGLNKFDGHTFSVYKSFPGDSSSLTSNKFRNIIEDKHGYLWVKTYDHNVYRFDKNTGKFLAINHRSGKRNVRIDRIFPLADGSTWLTTAGEGLLHVKFAESSNQPLIHRYARASKEGYKLPSDSVKLFFEDSRKVVWVGTSAGLVRIDPEQKGKAGSVGLKNKAFAPTLSFTSAVQTGDSIYFGTSQGKLVLFNIRSGRFSSLDLCKGTRINALHISKKRTLYAATTGEGLISLPLAGQTSVVHHLEGLDTFHSIYEDRGGRLWMEPKGDGVAKYEPNTGSLKLFRQKKDSHATSPGSNFLVFEDPNGRVWTRLKGGGFGYYNSAGDKLDYFYNEPGSAEHRLSNIVTALYPDKTGILWLATIDGGINKITFPGNNFAQKLMVSRPVTKSQNEVRLLFEDSRQRLWVGTKAGELTVFKDGKKQENLFDGIKESEIGMVYAIMEDRQGVVWLGTKGSGLLTATPLDASRTRYKLKRYLHDPANSNSLSHNTVYSILQDKKGRIWIGTFGGGLNQAVVKASEIYFTNHKSAFRAYPPASSYIRHLCEDPSGKIWIATTNGLIIADPDKAEGRSVTFRLFQKIPGDSSSLGNNEVQFIYKDRKNGMWLGTFGGGLNRLVSDVRSDNKKFRAYTQQNGLPNDIILSLAEDHAGHLWIATGKGLARFDTKTAQFRNYDAFDGLTRAQFSEATVFRSYNGDMYFGCMEGFISFDPSKIKNRKISANMALTNIQLYNNDIIPGLPGSPLTTSLNNTSHLVLDHDQNVISIDYTVLDYRAGQKVNYAYILKGYDKSWHYVRNQRKATYTKLPPGEYEFIVRSLNKEIFSNTPEKGVKITILPPPWLSWWAYLGYFLLFAALLAIVRRIVVTMMKLRNKVTIEQKLTELKLQFFTNISHELRTPLTLIVSPLDELSRTEPLSELGKRHLHTVSRNAKRMVRFVNQLLDFRKLQSGKMTLNVSETEILGLIRHAAGYFDAVAEEKRIGLKIESNVNELPAWVDPEKIDIVIYNLLSNAFKFSPSDATINVQLISMPEDESFDILIIDQGPGVPDEQLREIFDLYYEAEQSNNKLKGTGIGLALSYELIRAHKGQIFAENNPKGGMCFTLRLKSGRSHFAEDEVNFISSTDTYIETDHPVYNTDTENTLTNSNHDVEMPLVLLVEDNAELRKFMAGQLSSFYRVEEAGDGSEGLRKAQQCMPELIISDVMMPEMDGIQMLDQLKNNESTSHIPIILLTAKSSVENQIEGLRYGADFYITKPFNMQYLTALLENFLRRRSKQVELLQDDDMKIVALKPDEILITSRDEEFVKQVISIVESSMEDSEFNIELIAESVGFGRTTFYKKIKSLTGLAPVEFVREMRLKRCKQLLDTGGYTISEVAYMTGFKSAGYFSTCFKERYKQSPSAYMKSVKGGSID